MRTSQGSKRVPARERANMMCTYRIEKRVNTARVTVCESLSSDGAQGSTHSGCSGCVSVRLNNSPTRRIGAIKAAYPQQVSQSHKCVDSHVCTVHLHTLCRCKCESMVGAVLTGKDVRLITRRTHTTLSLSHTFLASTVSLTHRSQSPCLLHGKDTCTNSVKKSGTGRSGKQISTAVAEAPLERVSATVHSPILRFAVVWLYRFLHLYRYFTVRNKVLYYYKAKDKVKEVL